MVETTLSVGSTHSYMIARSHQRKDSPENLSVSSQDLKDKLEDVIEKLRKRVPHSDILDYLKVKDRNPLW